MDLTVVRVALMIGLFIGIIVCFEIGYRLGTYRSQRIDAWHEGLGAIEAAVFALLGLLLAFSFSGAATRFDARRDLIVQEANAIGTAYLRLDTLPVADQSEARRLFRDYLDARLRAYRKLPDLAAAKIEMAHATEIQKAIWTDAVAASRTDPAQAASRLLLPALNEMFDVTTTRLVVLEIRLPTLILVLLLSVALLSGLMAGHTMAQQRHRSWMHILVYALVISVTIYEVIDLDSPRSGFIRLDAADSALSQLRESIR